MSATCLRCGGDCRLTNGTEIYPHRPDPAEKKIWKRDACWRRSVAIPTARIYSAMQPTSRSGKPLATFSR